MNFAAIDVETANHKRNSICQIGVAIFSDGKLSEEWSWLIDPEDDFHERNVSIHKIERHMVAGQPKLPQIAEHLQRILKDTVSVSYTDFDRNALEQAYTKYGLSPISTSWFDATTVVRSVWTELSHNGYALKDVCKRIGYQFRPHDALEDAKAAGHVLLAALRDSGRSLDAWRNQSLPPAYETGRPLSLRTGAAGVSVPSSLSANSTTNIREGNPRGLLYGEVLVFSGDLFLPRDQAADLAASIGCKVAKNLTKTTTILVLGRPDPTRTDYGHKTDKHQKAEALVARGIPIRIMAEAEFLSLVHSAQSEV